MGRHQMAERCLDKCRGGDSHGSPHTESESKVTFFLKIGPNPASFLVYFRSFPQHKDKYSTNFTINDKSIDGVLGSRTQGGMMEVADESTELWRHPFQLT